MALSADYGANMLPRGVSDAGTAFDALAHPPRAAPGEDHILGRRASDTGIDFAHPPRSAPGKDHIVARDVLDDQLEGALGLAARQIGITSGSQVASPVQRRAAAGARRMQHKREASAYPSVVGDYFGGEYDGDTLRKQAMAGLSSASSSATHAASVMPSSSQVASAAAKSGWANGDIGTVYARRENGTLAVVTDASNVFVVEDGGDTSHGDALLAKIVTHESRDTSSLFWLVDATGNFCDNEEGETENNCFITLGDGFNLPTYSLTPYDVSENNGTLPRAMWTIDQKTGVLAAHADHHQVTFTQNENEVGNGDIDAYAHGETREEGYFVVDLLLKRD